MSLVAATFPPLRLCPLFKQLWYAFFRKSPERTAPPRALPCHAAGQSLVELGLLLPVLLLLLAGVVDLGLAFRSYTTVTAAAREGAQYGRLYPTDIPGVKTRVQAIVAGTNVTVADSDVRISFPNGNSPGQPIRVEVEAVYTPILGMVLHLPSFRVVGRIEMLIP